MQDARLTFLLAMLAMPLKWASITVKTGALNEQFMTPELRIMGLGECGPNENAATFYLPGGTYNYTADGGRWSGSVTVDNGDCQLVHLDY